MHVEFIVHTMQPLPLNSAAVAILNLNWPPFSWIEPGIYMQWPSTFENI